MKLKDIHGHDGMVRWPFPGTGTPPRFIRLFRSLFFFMAFSAVICSPSVSAAQLEAGSLTEEAHVWHPLTLDFRGPVMNEDDMDPNPFLDFRLDVSFIGPTGRVYRIPGFFDGDGKGGGSGCIWRTRFTPDSSGWWNYIARFRAGEHIAIRTDFDNERVIGFSQQKGRFLVKANPSRAAGFLGKGRLAHVEGSYYLKTLGDGRYWIKGGTNTPENFMAYAGFDNTLPNPARPEWFHRYSRHVRHWKTGDPNWEGAACDGKGIIGALNYLSSKNVNSIYVLLNNIGGDGQDVWPYSGTIDPGGAVHNDNRHFDISKLSQWEIVFSHAQTKGILLHFVLAEGERENKMELDDAALGLERKLFYREMIARFAHHNGIQWNLCEEYDGRDLPLEPEMIKTWGGFIKALDPYGHPVTVLNWHPSAWDPFFGDDRLDVVSFQYREDVDYGKMTEEIRKKAFEAARVIPVGIDESNHTSRADSHGCRVSGWLRICGQHHIRQKIIYPVYFSGGNIELILEELLETEDFKEYEKAWDYMSYARTFLEALPFWEMAPNDHLLIQAKGKGEVFSNDAFLAVYLPEGGEGSLDLRRMPGPFRLQWYNPRKGIFEEGARVIPGGGIVSLGLPPRNLSSDWVVKLERVSGSTP